METKQRAGRNRTITLTDHERETLRKQLLFVPFRDDTDFLNHIVCGNTMEVLPLLPQHSVDLAFIDPPYNLNKTFNQNSFSKMDMKVYADWMDSWLKLMIPSLKPEASVYVCGDWRSSSAIYEVMSAYLYVHNRITWEREKGRGALSNWKNASEDIWFGSLSKEYFFNVDAVKMRRKVIAPYRDDQGRPKDWDETDNGNFRVTHPSNLWTDLTVPFWSMPENTDHPTQKPEKLLAKVILASSRPGDVVLDPFLGSGTTAVVAKKLGRQFIGIDMEDEYCCLAQKRLEMADEDPSIQGYHEGVFWERNTLSEQKQEENKVSRESHRYSRQVSLFSEPLE